MSDLLGNWSSLPTSLSHSLAGSSLHPPEWKLSGSGEEGPKLCPESGTSETGAVTGQAEQIEGGDDARFVPRLLGLSGNREGWPNDPVATSASCPLSQLTRKRHFDKRPEATGRTDPSLYASYLYI